MRLILLSSLLGVASLPALATPTDAYACSCGWEPGTTRLGDADVVFHGRLVAFEEGHTFGATLATFEVIEVQKGSGLGPRAVVRDAGGGGTCRVLGPTSATVQVYARIENNEFVTDYCSGTHEVDQWMMPVPPAVGSAGPTDRSGDTPLLLAGAAVAAAAAASLLLGRLRFR